VLVGLEVLLCLHLRLLLLLLLLLRLRFLLLHHLVQRCGVVRGALRLRGVGRIPWMQWLDLWIAFGW